MYFTVDDVDFVSRNFAVHVFYGETTCFCWDDAKLVVFPYTTENARSGIYKLSREHEFAVLSKSAVGMGTIFYEALTARNKYLYLYNKQTMTSKRLFELASSDSGSNKLSTYPLGEENTDARLLQSMRGDQETKGSLCVIADGKKIFKLINEAVHIIYSSVYPVFDIVPVQRESKIAGLLFLTGTDTVVIMHSREDKLVFEKIPLGTTVQAICAGFSQRMEDTAWIVYSDESKFYYAKKRLAMDSVQRMKVQDKSFTCLQCYDSKLILGLTADKELSELSVDTVEKTLSTENDTFINLRADMLKGTEVLMDQIYTGIRRLHALNQKLANEQNKLRRINLYAHRQKLHAIPKVLVHRISNRSYLSVRLNNPLPKSSRIVLAAISNGAMTFCVKDVGDLETAIDLYIPENNATDCPNISLDLVAVSDKGKPWCLVRNYVSEPPNEKNIKKRSRIDKSNFINAKIAMLRDLIAEGSTDMNKLSDIKRSIRKEFGEI